MFAVLMRFVMLMGVLTGIYIALGWYMRWDRTRRLDAEHASGEGSALTREDYIAKGLAEYDRSWEKKLLVGIYVIPVAVVVLLALIANYG